MDRLHRIEHGIEQALPMDRLHQLEHALPIDRLQGSVERVQQALPVERVQHVLTHDLLPGRRRKRGKGKLFLFVLLPLAAIAAVVIIKQLRGGRQPADSWLTDTQHPWPHNHGQESERLPQGLGAGGAPTPSAGAASFTPQTSAPNSGSAGRTVEMDREAILSGPAVIEGREHQGLPGQPLMGRTVVDVDGHQIGSVEAVYYRGEGHPPEWIALRTGSVNARRVLVPLDDAMIDEAQVRVAYPTDIVKEAPAVEADSVAESEEAALYSHYNLRRVTEGDDAGLAIEMTRLRVMTPNGR
jgi:hypothetical protein